MGCNGIVNLLSYVKNLSNIEDFPCNDMDFFKRVFCFHLEKFLEDCSPEEIRSKSKIDVILLKRERYIINKDKGSYSYYCIEFKSLPLNTSNNKFLFNLSSPEKIKETLENKVKEWDIYKKYQDSNELLTYFLKSKKKKRRSIYFYLLIEKRIYDKRLKISAKKSNNPFLAGILLSANFAKNLGESPLVEFINFVYNSIKEILKRELEKSDINVEIIDCRDLINLLELSF
jgi:hypothetical protein